MRTRAPFRTALCAVMAAAWPASPGAAAAQPLPVSVLVDGSGSMQGFGSELPRLVETLRGAGADRAYTFTYRSDGGQVRGGVEPFHPGAGPRGNVTLLWRGLEDYLERNSRDGEMIALVTDNLQDPGSLSHEQRDVEEFYAELTRDPRLRVVYVVPLRLPFSGTLYGRGGSIGSLEGERGLVLYLVSHGRVDEGRAAAAARAVAGQLGSEPVRMKPYLTAPVRAMVDTAATRRAAGAATGGECPTGPLVPHAAEPNVLTRADPLTEGRPFGGTFVLRLTSQLEGVSLARPAVSARVLDDFKLTDFVANGDVDVATNPPRLATNFEPGDSARIRVNVCFPQGVAFRQTSLGTLLRFALAEQPEGRYEGGVRVGLRVPRADLRLAESVRAAFSTLDPAFFTRPDPALHRRVYGLEKAFGRLAPEVVEVEAPADYRIRFAVSYPKWPALLLLIPLLALALFIFLVWLLLRSRVYRLEQQGPGSFYFAEHRPRRRAGGTEPLDPAAMDLGGRSAADAGERGTLVRLSYFRRHPLIVDGSAAAELRRRPFTGPQVAALPGYLIDGDRRVKPLHSGGTSFEVGPGEAPRPSGGGSRRGADAAGSAGSIVLDPSSL